MPKVKDKPTPYDNSLVELENFVAELQFSNFCDEILEEIIEIEDEIHLENFLEFSELLYKLANEDNINIEIFPNDAHCEL